MNEPSVGAHPRAILAATILGSSLAFIDGSVVNVALPTLAHDLGAVSSLLPWTINAYLLPVGALTLLGGSLGDHFGRRRLFLLGLAIFTAASLLCGTAPSFAWLLSARGLQGLGAALLMPNSLALLGSEFAGEARGRAIGTWAAAGALAGALGPLIGGWLIDVVGWRVIFYINLPIALVAGYLAWRYLGERSEAAPSASLDWLGALLITVSLGLLTWGLTEASAADKSASGSLVAAVAGIVLLAGFVGLQRRRGDRAMMPRALFTGRAFVGLNLLTFFLYGSLGGLLVLLPYLLIRIAHWSTLAAGAALLPIPALIGIGSRYMGDITERHGARAPLMLGCIVVGMGLALYSSIGSDSIHYSTQVLPATLLVALGMGACVAPLTTSVITAVDRDHVGIASGFNSAVARISGLAATACLGFVFARQNSTANFVHAFHAAAYIGAGSAILAGACAMTLPRVGATRRG